MSKLKTKKNEGSVTAYINGLENPTRRSEARQLVALMRRVTGQKPTMWGTSMVGFGSYHYTYASGREGDWFATGFAARKQAMTVYLIDGFDEYGPLLEALGKHSLGKSCLYLKSLADVDLAVLEELIERSYAAMLKSNPAPHDG
ncbi:MAG TPA: DUF1801 domain-containing protein [Actinomycetes bacterium]|nr:DUF1801 domain-containing protein [Actinomycetes bacterium]